MDLSTSIRSTNMAFPVPLSGMKPYCSGAISCKVLPLILLIAMRSTNFVTWLIKLIVRYFSHLIVPFTFGSAINIDVFSSPGKLPCTYIILTSLVSSVIPISLAATNMSVVISSGSGLFSLASLLKHVQLLAE